jgi:anti-sigma factor RsiW
VTEPSVEPEGIHELAAAYVLHALEDDEQRAFEEHLGRCTVCKEELASLSRAAAALAYAAEGPAPPDALRVRLLEDVRHEGAVVVPLRRRWVLPAAASLAAVAACAAIGLAVWTASLSSSLDSERAARRAQAQALAIVASPGARRFALSGAHGAVIVTPEGSAALAIARVPKAAPGTTYEAWVVQGGAPRRAGLFTGGADQALVLLSHRVARSALVGVSVERTGGVDSPTGPMIFQAETA